MLLAVVNLLSLSLCRSSSLSLSFSCAAVSGTGGGTHPESNSYSDLFVKRLVYRFVDREAAVECLARTSFSVAELTLFLPLVGRTAGVKELSTGRGGLGGGRGGGGCWGAQIASVASSSSSPFFAFAFNLTERMWFFFFSHKNAPRAATKDKESETPSAIVLAVGVVFGAGAQNGSDSLATDVEVG